MVDQNYEAAVFNDIGNSPATMDAARSADCYGCCPGHTIQIADAKQAYIQAELKGVEVWVCLPPDVRPAGWANTRSRCAGFCVLSMVTPMLVPCGRIIAMKGSGAPALFAFLNGPVVTSWSQPDCS